VAHIVFYEKPGCGGNAKQRALLEAAGHSLDRRDLLASVWTPARLLTFFGDRPVAQWFNAAAPRVKSREIVPGTLEPRAALELLVADPILIRRPLMEREDGGTLVGFDVAEVERFVGLSGGEVAGGQSFEGCAAAHPTGAQTSYARPGGLAAGRDAEQEGAPAAPKPACSLREALRPDESVRVIPPFHDVEFPAVPFPSLRVLRLAGEPTLRALVLRHHERLLESPIADLFPTDRAVFAALVERVADFVIEACGGASKYSDTHGFTCMRTRHLPFTIDEHAREAWLEALWRAMGDVAFPDDAREEYWSWLEAMSVRMINRRTTRAQPARYPYAQMRARDEANGAAPGARGLAAPSTDAARPSPLARSGRTGASPSSAATRTTSSR
jgi:hemoglobin